MNRAFELNFMLKRPFNLLIFSILITSACSPLYFSSTKPIILLEEKGDAMLLGSLGSSGLDGAAAYAPSQHFAIASSISYNPQHVYSPRSSSFYTSFAMGPIIKGDPTGKSYIRLLPGVGWGKGESSYFYRWVSGNKETEYYQIFLNPEFSVKISEWAYFVSTLRVGWTNFYYFLDEQRDDNTFGPRSNFLFEPSFSLIIGKGRAKVFSQGGFVTEIGKMEQISPVYLPVHLAFGFRYDLSKRYRKSDNTFKNIFGQ